jgi:outer membrane protein assembly factor BamB
VNVQVMAGHLYSLDADTGQIRWKLTTSLSFVPPTPSDEAVIAVRSLSSVARVNEQTGALEWETGVLLPNSWFPWIEAGPRVQGGLVYVGTGEETLHALDLKNGVEAWRAEIPHSPVALVVTPKAVIVACQLPPQTGASGPAGSLHAFDPRTGMPLWERAAGLTAGANLIPVFLSTDGETMLLTSGDGLLEVISPATGATVASTTLGVAVTGEPLVAGETAYVPIADGAVLAVSLRNIEATPIPATSVP